MVGIWRGWGEEVCPGLRGRLLGIGRGGRELRGVGGLEVDMFESV